MNKSAEQPTRRENLGEKASRFLRNINALGAVAFTGAAIAFPEFSGPLLAFAALDVAQAGFFEVTRRLAKKRNQKLQASPA